MWQGFLVAVSKVWTEKRWRNKLVTGSRRACYLSTVMKEKNGRKGKGLIRKQHYQFLDKRL